MLRWIDEYTDEWIYKISEVFSGVGIYLEQEIRPVEKWVLVITCFPLTVALLLVFSLFILFLIFLITRKLKKVNKIIVKIMKIVLDIACWISEKMILMYITEAIICSVIVTLQLLYSLFYSIVGIII